MCIRDSFLAEQPNHVFSKEEILASVWKDTVVDDQVIFQSINEIRKETGHANVIKTYPRRGYSWTVVNTNIDKKISQEELKLLGTSAGKNKAIYLLSGLGLIGLLLVYFVTGGVNHTTQRPTISSNFPVETNLTNSHKGILVLLSLIHISEPTRPY